MASFESLCLIFGNDDEKANKRFASNDGFQNLQNSTMLIFVVGVITIP
jgi:hypothetical protein